MPNIRSAAKAMRSAAKKRMRNKSVKSALKTLLSKAQRLIAQDPTEEAGPALTRASSGLDKAAQKGIIHPNKAARHKSRLMKKLNSAQKARAIALLQAEAAKPKRRAPRKTPAKAAALPEAEAAKPKRRAPGKTPAKAAALPEAEAAEPKKRAARKTTPKA